MLNRAGVAIDESVVVPCPRKEFKPALAAEACPKCEYFDGIAVMSTSCKLAWCDRYCIRCTHPIERRVQPITFKFKEPGRIKGPVTTN